MSRVNEMLDVYRDLDALSVKMRDAGLGGPGSDLQLMMIKVKTQLQTQIGNQVVHESQEKPA